MADLENLGEKWLDLIRHAKIDEAEGFFWKEMYCLVEKNFLEKYVSANHCDWLILPVGLEAYLYILLIKALKPRKVYFLCTEEFRNNFLDKVVKETGFGHSDYMVDVLSYEGMDVADVYERIRKHLDLFLNKKVVLDLTRGKRIMSVGAGIVGAFFGFDLVYIDERWVDDVKRGLPGSESLVYVRNPFEVFGDLEGQEARELFNHNDFGAALSVYKRLKEKVADPRKILTEELLAESYLHWNSFNFKAAFQKIDQYIKKAKQYNFKLSQQIHDNWEALQILSSAEIHARNEDFHIHIILDLYANALRKASAGMFEDAVSRLYRVLELISQYRLRSYGIETSNPKLNDLAGDYKKVTMRLYGFEKEIPFEIGLKDGYILLYIMKDYILDKDSFEDLKYFFDVVKSRDMSIVAHGLKLVGEKPFSNMDVLAKKFIKRICLKRSLNFDKLIRQHTFLKL